MRLARAATSAVKAASPVTIQYATWDATREKADKKVIAAFEKSHPEIKVKYNLVAWDTYWQKAAAMTAGGADTALDYIDSPSVVNVSTCDLTASSLVSGRIHRVYCSGTLKITGTINEVALVTSAPIQFAKEAVFEDAIIATTNTTDMSLKGPSSNGGGKKGSGLDNITFGKNDDCQAGGGVQLVTMGGVHMAAGLNMFGSQMLWAGSIEFTANADGIEGISLVSADTVSGTSNMQMGFCGSGMENNFEVDYYRLAY